MGPALLPTQSQLPSPAPLGWRGWARRDRNPAPPEIGQPARRRDSDSSESRGAPDGLLELRPSKQISQARLEQVRFRLISGGMLAGGRTPKPRPASIGCASRSLSCRSFTTWFATWTSLPVRSNLLYRARYQRLLRPSAAADFLRLPPIALRARARPRGVYRNRTRHN